MKKLLFLVCLLLILSGGALAQQIERIDVKKVRIDSLVTLSNKNFGIKIYYQGNTNIDSLNFTISSTKKDFTRDLENILRPEGFSITVLGDNVFILMGEAIVKDFPEGYFVKNDDKVHKPSNINQSVLNEGVAKSENKIYKVGDSNLPKKTGRAILSGYVKDVGTGEPLIGVAVYIENPNTSATTDAYGFYRIPLPKGEQNLMLKGYGLEDTKLMLDVYGDGQLDIALKEKVYSLKSVVLSAESTHNLRSTQMGLEKVRIDRIKHVPAAFGEADVMKIVLTLPGVKTVGEASGGFNVRGGATDQNLILFN